MRWRRRRNDRGAVLVEYPIIVGALVVAGFAGLGALMDIAEDDYSDAGNSIGTAVTYPSTTTTTAPPLPTVTVPTTPTTAGGGGSATTSTTSRPPSTSPPTPSTSSTSSTTTTTTTIVIRGG